MYRDSYHDDYERDLEPRTVSSYPRDPYYEERSRERAYDYEDRDRSSSRYAPPLPPLLGDDPYYRRLDELESRVLPRARDPPVSSHELHGEVLGSVVLIPNSPFDPAPKRKPREKPANCDTVFVGSLPDKATDKHLRDLFEKCGKIGDVRVARGRNFGHVQFIDKDAVDIAILLNGCRIRIGPASNHANVARIHVDFAQARGEPEFRRRITSGEIMTFGSANASTISNDLHRDESFQYATKHIMQWIEKGNCSSSTSSTFFSLISGVNTHCRKVSKNMKVKQDEVAEAMRRKAEAFAAMQSDCEMAVALFDMASTQKAWDNFTKPQRKTISGWKDFAVELLTQVKEGKEEGAMPLPIEEREPVAKKPRRETTSDTELEADLERAHKEIEQLKTDHEITVEKKDKQILQLKTLLARFKQTCPEEWEKALGITKKDGEDKALVAVKVEGENGVYGEGSEVIDGVNLDDLNAAMQDEGGTSSLAAAAAAYAQMRSTITKSESEASGHGMTEAEIAMVSVIATFLTVHPLGATFDEIVQYFQVFNPTANGIYLESLLRRLPQVFQLSQSPEGQAKWWFLGFQTCCTQSSRGAMESQSAGVKTVSS